MSKVIVWCFGVALLAANSACGSSGVVSSREGTRGGSGGQVNTDSSASGGKSSASTTATSKTAEPERRFVNEEQGVFPKDRVLDIQVTMPEEDWANLIANARDEVWSRAAVTIDEQALGSVGIRPKGEYSLDSCVENGVLTCDKLSLKLKFDESDPDQRFYGLKRLALNKIVDGSALFMETLGYDIFNRFGIVAPRTSYATVTLNGESLGIYTVVEIVDGRFTDKHFDGGDGNLYKEAWPARTDVQYFAQALETNKETATHEAFIRFAADMLAATEQDLPKTLAKYMDLNQVLDYMAVDYAIANWDGITTFYAGNWGHTNHNYFMYQSEDAAHFTLIPWDLNATFFLEHWLGAIQPWDALDVDCEQWVLTEDSTDLYTIPATCDPMIRAIALSKEQYRASVRRLLEQVFIVDELNARVDEILEQVASPITRDPFVSVGEFEGGGDYMKGQFQILRDRLAAVLGENLDP